MTCQATEMVHSHAMYKQTKRNTTTTSSSGSRKINLPPAKQKIKSRRYLPFVWAPSIKRQRHTVIKIMIQGPGAQRCYNILLHSLLFIYIAFILLVYPFS